EAPVLAPGGIELLLQPRFPATEECDLTQRIRRGKMLLHGAVEPERDRDDADKDDKNRFHGGGQAEMPQATRRNARGYEAIVASKSRSSPRGRTRVWALTFTRIRRAWCSCAQAWRNACRSATLASGVTSSCSSSNGKGRCMAVWLRGGLQVRVHSSVTWLVAK